MWRAWPLPSLISVKVFVGRNGIDRADELRQLFDRKPGETQVRLRLEAARDFSVILDVPAKVRPDREFRAELAGSAAPTRWKFWAADECASVNRLRITTFGIACAQGLLQSELMKTLQRFLKDEQGQDLIEYTLLMAFIALASAAIFTSAGGSISGIWGTASNQLSTANAGAS